MKTTRRMDQLIAVQSDLDDAQKRFDYEKDRAKIYGSWRVGSGPDELNQAYRRLEKAEAVYNAVLDALQAKPAYVERITDAFMRYCMNANAERDEYDRQE